MTAHTPGPWMVGGTLRADALAVIGDGDSVVCEFPDRLGASVDVDARLIAAAPELLEALEDLASLAEAAMREVGEYDIEAELADARAAIAKATGGAA